MGVRRTRSFGLVLLGVLFGLTVAPVWSAPSFEELAKHYD